MENLDYNTLGNSVKPCMNAVYWLWFIVEFTLFAALMMVIMYVCRASSLNDYAFNFKANSALGRPKIYQSKQK